MIHNCNTTNHLLLTRLTCSMNLEPWSWLHNMGMVDWALISLMPLMDLGDSEAARAEGSIFPDLCDANQINSVSR